MQSMDRLTVVNTHRESRFMERLFVELLRNSTAER